MNQEEWFLSEFSRYGFSLSPTMYDPYTFCPIKCVMITDGNRMYKTNIKITPELSDDLHGWGMTYDHHVEALRELIRMEVRRQYGHLLIKDFKPVERVNKFIFCP